MKRSFLFPLVYLLLVGAAFVFNSDGLFMILTAQMALLMLGVELLLGREIGESIYFLMLLQTLQLFFIGLIWDKISIRFNNNR